MLSGFYLVWVVSLRDLKVKAGFNSDWKLSLQPEFSVTAMLRDH